jgi:hypothetical protein
MVSEGSPASCRISTSAKALSGVFSEGFSTTALSAAIAGASFTTGWLSGRLNGVMARTTPTGSFHVTANFRVRAAVTSVGMASPRRWVATSA